MKEINHEHRMRLRFCYNALDNANERLKNAFRENNDSLFYASIGELLLWINMIDDWYLKFNIDNYENRRNRDTDGEIIKGLRHAYNMMKHNMEFMQIHYKTSDLVIPFTIPSRPPTLIINWLAAGNVLEGDYPNQKKNYEKHLEGKEVWTTMSQAVSFVKKEYQKFLFGNN